MKRMNIQVTDETHEFLKLNSKRLGVPMATQLTFMIEKAVKEEKMLKDLPALLKAYEELKQEVEK